MQLLSRLVLVALIVSLGSCSNSPPPAKKRATKPRKKAPVVRPVETDEPEPEAKPSSEMPVEETGSKPPGDPEEKPIASPGTPIPDLPPLELAKQEFQFEQFQPQPIKYSMPTPADAKIKADQDKITLNGGPRFNVKIEFGRHDLKTLAEQQLTLAGTSVVTQTPDTLVLELSTVDLKQITRRVQTHEFYKNVSFGYRDFKISSSGVDQSFNQCFYSGSDVQTMLKAAEQFALAEALPENPIELLTRLNATVHLNDKGEAHIAILPAFGITDATLPLLGKLPTLVQLKARGLQVADRSWEVLGQLPNLELLDLEGVALRDEGIASICQLHKLKTLDIGEDKLPLSAIKQLEKLESLEKLSVGSFLITDASMDQFPTLPHVQELYIRGSWMGEQQLNGLGLAQLAKLPQLRILDVSQVHITDDGFQGIGKLTSLKKLNAQQCEHFQGPGIAHLVSLTQLEELLLASTKIDDSAVEPLGKLKSLKVLDVRGTKLTDAGFAKLKAELPNCEIHH